MAIKISYNKLWKLLVDKMSKAELRKTAGIAPNTMTKIRKDEVASKDVLLRICDKLNCNIGEMMDVVREEVIDLTF